MVFYGKKRSEIEQQTEDYRSINEEILKELGERITPVYEKSLATIFQDVGDVVLIATQTVLSIPEKFKKTQLYDAYQIDKAQFKYEIKDDRVWYQALPKRITENKFYIIKNYSCESRIFFLNTAVFLLGILSTRLNKTFATKIRGLICTSLFGYGFGGIFAVPEIYNSIMTKKIIV